MKAPTTIQTRYTVNFCEPIRWEKVSSLERDMNHNTAMKGRRPNRDDEINNRPVNKKISHIGCSILDWNNALILSNPFSKWIGFNWNEWWFILFQSSFMPCRFPTFQEPYQTWQILSDHLRQKCTIVGNGIRWCPKEGNQVGFTSRRENIPNFFRDCFHCEFLDFMGSLRKEFI